MHEAYDLAHNEIINTLKNGGQCLDCGASTGGKYEYLNEKIFPIRIIMELNGARNLSFKHRKKISILFKEI